MPLTYLDTSVLIAAARGADEIARRAFEILDDPQRSFAASTFLELEAVPKAVYYRHGDEVRFYEVFLESCAVRVQASESLVRRAMLEATHHGLGAFDALHIISALEAGAAELVTGEGVEKPIHRSKLVRVISIQ